MAALTHMLWQNVLLRFIHVVLRYATLCPRWTHFPCVTLCHAEPSYDTLYHVMLRQATFMLRYGTL